MNFKKLFKNVLDLFKKKSEAAQTEEPKPVEAPKLKPRQIKYKHSKRVMRVDLPGEIWQPLEKYPGYAVSSLGRVCHLKKNYILHPGIIKNRYYYQINRKTNSIYQLMCDTFFEKPEISGNEKFIPHLINGDTKDIRLDNLAWRIFEYDESRNLKSQRIVEPILKNKPVEEPKPEPEEKEPEEWRVIEDYPKYSISSLGRIKSNKTGNVLNNNGYTSVRLVRSKDDYHSITIIKLVAEAFLPKPEISDKEKLRIKTKNGDKLDVRASNLEWIVVKSGQTIQEAREARDKKEREAKGNMSIAQYRIDGKLVRKYKDVDDVLDTHRHYYRDYIEYLLESGEPDKKKYIWKKI